MSRKPKKESSWLNIIGDIFEALADLVEAIFVK
jgi:hypothetical protein